MKKQCVKCKGCGLIKQETIVCNLCNGKKCVMCGESGFSQLPYTTCIDCDGLGTIINTFIKK